MLQQCAGTLQMQRVSGWRLAHLRSEQNGADRFPPVWTVEQQEACFMVRDASLAYAYVKVDQGDALASL